MSDATQTILLTDEQLALVRKLVADVLTTKEKHRPWFRAGRYLWELDEELAQLSALKQHLASTP